MGPLVDADEAQRGQLRVHQMLVQRLDEALAAEAHAESGLVEEGERVDIAGR